MTDAAYDDVEIQFSESIKETVLLALEKELAEIFGMK